MASKTQKCFYRKTIAPINCKNVLIEGVTLDQGLYWNIVPQYCENVIIRGVTVTSFGHGRTDGIDVESSRNVLIEYCSLDCSDDCYTIKSGRGEDGVKIGSHPRILLSVIVLRIVVPVALFVGQKRPEASVMYICTIVCLTELTRRSVSRRFVRVEAVQSRSI